MMNCLNFTYAGYRTLLSLLKENYIFKSLGEVSTQLSSLSKQSIAVLRHDVDFSLDSAEKMAEIESDMGISSTYYLLPDTQFYNLLDPKIFQKVKKIISLNHKLGLHFDLSAYPLIEHTKKIEQHRQFLENIFSIKLDSMSFHNPVIAGIETIDRSLLIQGLVNSYAHEIAQRFTYRSDSMCYFRDQNLIENIKNGSYTNLHLLIHPEWWTDEVKSRDQKFTAIVEANTKKLELYYSELKTNFALKEKIPEEIQEGTK